MPVDLGEISILYIDDNRGDIENFERKANRYNMNLDNEDSVRLTVTCCAQINEAIELFDESSKEFDVIICDHNMPGKKGLDLILNYFKPEKPDITYVLYTGAGNLTYDIRQTCKKHQILFFEKSETFPTLIGQIVTKAFFKRTESPTEKLYYLLANEIISSLEQISKFDPDFEIYIGEKVFKPSQMIAELQNRTLTGFDYIESYIEGLKFFNRQL